MADRNKVELTGLAISEPTITKMGGSRTSITTFLLQVNEEYLAGGKKAYHSNVITVESLGQQAETVLEKVRKGVRYEVVGYLRADNHKFSIRTFAVNKENKDDSTPYYNGLEAALEVIMTSIDKEAAIDNLRRILQEK